MILDKGKMQPPLKHADTHLTYGKDRIMPENMGAAPDGYGLGKDAIIVNSSNNYSLDEISGSGWYIGVPAITGFVFGFCLVEHVNYDYIRCVQKAYIISDTTGMPNDTILIRTKTQNGWGSWEWLNPPMKLGVEYRTTERYLDKPVYVKVVDCGACPSSGYKDVTGWTQDSVLPVRCYGTFTYGNRSTLPFESTEQDQMHVGVIARDTIRIRTGGKDFSAYACYVTVYYTKTTD